MQRWNRGALSRARVAAGSGQELPPAALRAAASSAATISRSSMNQYRRTP